MADKVKKRLKMPSSYVVLFLIIAIVSVLTWFIPAGQYEVVDGNVQFGTYTLTEQNPQGIYEMLMAPVRGMLGTDSTLAAIDVAFFIMMVGGFLGVVTETGALDVGIASIVRKNKGREKRLIWILMIVFALGGTTYGMGEETMAFYPLLVPVMLAVGFDTITAVAIILIGSQVGCLASTVNPFATGVASDAAGISIADGIIWRIIFLVVCLAISIVYVYRYASKVEKDAKHSLVYSHAEEDKKFFKVTETNEVEATLTGKQKTVLGLFVLTFTIMIISLIPWADFGFNFFVDLNKFLTSIPIVGQVIGHPEVLGSWYFPEISMLFIAMSVVIGVVYGIKEDRFIAVFMSGVADLLSVALICAIARGIQVVMNDGMITATILNWGEQTLSGLSSQVFIVLTYIFYLPMSFLIPSTSGLAGATMGIMAPLGQVANVPAHLVITAYQAASGLLNLITPTSGIVMGALALGRVDITTWWKFIAKLIVILFFASIAILVVASFFS